MLLRIAFLVLFGAFLTQVHAEEVTDSDRFQLWNNCQPMDLLVEDVDDDGAQIGLTRESIEVAVRSRLRSARLYDPDATEYLYVSATVIPHAFTVDAEYSKWLYDARIDDQGYAATWSWGSVGKHDNNKGYILSDVSEMTDQFIDDYLRVNSDACE